MSDDPAAPDGVDAAAGSMAARKAALRKRAFAARKAAKAADPDAGHRAAERFLAEIAVETGDIVAGYRPIRTEIDPTPLMIALHDRGIRLCAPVIKGEGLPLDFRAWTPMVDMVAGPFGAEVPATGDWVEPTLLVAPLVAWDRTGRRLGYGGGFYDRSLEQLRARRPTRAVGFAFAAQELDAIPAETTDARLDALVTEACVLRFAAE